MNTLLLLCLGGGRYPDEAIHAAVSARYRLGRDRDACRIVVCTDDPAPFRGVPVEVETVSPETLAAWPGPVNYRFRAKPMAMRAMMEKYGGPLLFCDTDTYFLRHPRKLFDRIRPGQTVMHLREGTPQSLRLDGLSQLLANCRFVARDGRPWNLSPHTPIFNSGVIGLHEADRGLLDEVIHLIDQICPLLPAYLATEQFAFSACLSERTRVTPADDVVHHYWHPATRAQFHARLAGPLRDGSIGSYDDRFRRMRRIRERALDRAESLSRHAYVALWQAADRLGIRTMLASVMRRIGSRLMRARRV